MKKINMNQYGYSHNGMVMTDMPTNQLVAMRDAINDLLQKRGYEVEDPIKEKYLKEIRDAITRANDAGYTLYDDDGYSIEGVQLCDDTGIDDDEDDENDDYWEDEDDSWDE